MNMDDLLEIRRRRARENNNNRFTINPNPVKTKTRIDPLGTERRKKIDEIKDKLTYPDDVELW